MEKKKLRKPKEQQSGKPAERTMRSSFDVLGSYTGTSADGEKPVQDADDL